MAYLPPSGGNNNNNNPLSEILPGIVTIAATVLFFMSPLGSIFFAITNSLFLLALITPIVLYTGFQIWLKFNTIQAPCPNCDFPLVVTKEEGATPSVCLNCGSFVRATRDNKDLELCSNGQGMNDMGQENGLFGGDMFGDLFGNGDSSSQTGYDFEEKQKKRAREKTVIDIDVLED